MVVRSPTMVAAIYYGLCRDQSICAPSSSSACAPQMPSVTMPPRYFRPGIASQIGLQSNIVVQYIKSREIVDAINQKIDLRKICQQAVHRLPVAAGDTGTHEDLVAFWRSKVGPYFDNSQQGIISVRVRQGFLTGRRPENRQREIGSSRVVGKLSGGIYGAASTGITSESRSRNR